ncbi:hypothetical protein [Klebsiella pneumoniae]|uniref:hypothetical protein n=1 Tax=Klebsiella pneumoniae TaxID=573 RepID=UPI0022711081|nr:hypothetical protein [Klebsiella pneumoniae]MCY0160089.1 hypothetical protein [Klebsiella pneumoniae]
MTTGTDYQPVSNAEDAFHLKQNPNGMISVGLRRHEAQQNDAELAHDYAAADDQQWSAQEYADYEHYAEASTTTLTAAFTTITPCRRRLRRNRAIPEKNTP